MELKVILFGIEKRSRNISGKVKNFVFERDNGKCIYCGSFENLEFDHIIPASKGGSNTERNIQLVCFRCNRVKFNYIDDDNILEKRNKLKKKGKRISNSPKIIRIGNSKGFIIPGKIFKELELQEGDLVQLDIKKINNKLKVLIEPID